MDPATPVHEALSRVLRSSLAMGRTTEEILRGLSLPESASENEVVGGAQIDVNEAWRTFIRTYGQPADANRLVRGPSIPIGGPATITVSLETLLGINTAPKQKIEQRGFVEKSGLTPPGVPAQGTNQGQYIGPIFYGEGAVGGREFTFEDNVIAARLTGLLCRSDDSYISGSQGNHCVLKVGTGTTEDDAIWYCWAPCFSLGGDYNAQYNYFFQTGPGFIGNAPALAEGTNKRGGTAYVAIDGPTLPKEMAENVVIGTYWNEPPATGNSSPFTAQTGSTAYKMSLFFETLSLVDAPEEVARRSPPSPRHVNGPPARPRDARGRFVKVDMSSSGE